jgi:pyridoxal phosphate enzyme (YggS family)
MRLATRLDRFSEELSRRLPVLLQINVSGEATKSGWAAWDAETSAATLREIEGLAKMEHLEVRGLMTMAPLVDDAELARPVFRALRELRDLYRQKLDFSAWRDLSMGMTNDFEVAIEEGATLVRIGRAIFDPSI